MSGEHNFEAFAKMYNNDKLAEVAECHKSTVYAYKKGNPIPSDVVIRIADYYKVSTDRVLGRVLPAEALTKENFPNARPSVAFTVSETQLDHAKENRELKFNNEMLKKQITELNEKIAIYVRRVAEFDEIHRRQSAELKSLQELQEQTIPNPVLNTAMTPAQIAEITRLRAILQSIHFLSEEK